MLTYLGPDLPLIVTWAKKKQQQKIKQKKMFGPHTLLIYIITTPMLFDLRVCYMYLLGKFLAW